jgi:hypothetical protein
MILVITSQTQMVPRDCGDGVIATGLMRLWPELAGQRMIFTPDVPDDAVDDAVAGCQYIVQAGTPAWFTSRNWRWWAAAARHKKRISFLGIGMGLSYYWTWWYGSEPFIRLRDSGLVDQIVCRDRYTHFWLGRRLGFDFEKMRILPCPGFFAAEPGQPSDRKLRVLLSIANPEETGHSVWHTFEAYFVRTGILISSLVVAGATVTIIYQRGCSQEFIDQTSETLGGYPIRVVTDIGDLLKLISEHDVYVGARIHGALPMAGAGKPAFLLGTDERQHAATEIPFVARQDMSHVPFDPTSVLDWWQSLDAGGVSRSLVEYRVRTEARWRDVLNPLNERIGA